MSFNPINQAAARHSPKAYAYRLLELKLRDTRRELNFMGAVYGDRECVELAATVQRASLRAAAKRRQIMKGPADAR